MSDIFTLYETCLMRLLKRLGSDHPRYTEALVYQHRLQENITEAQRYGDTQTLRADRAQIVDSLNRLALEETGLSFNELCREPVPTPPTPTLSRVWVLLALLILDFCLVILWGWRWLGDQPDLWTYLGTVATIVALLLAILFFIFRIRRPVELESILRRLINRQWTGVIFGLSGLILIITLLVWFPGWVGQYKSILSPRFLPTPTPVLSLNIKLDNKVTNSQQIVTRDVNFIWVEVEILSNGIEMLPTMFEYKWFFTPSDAQNADKDWSKNYVIEYHPPQKLQYQVLTVCVRGVGQGWCRSIHFIIRE